MNVSKRSLTLLIVAMMVTGMLPSVMMANAALGDITYNGGAVPGTSVKGDLIKVVGVGPVAAGTLVEIYWDDTTKTTWDSATASGKLNSTAASGTGAWEVWFKVPSCVYGVHTLWIKEVSSGITNTATFNIRAKISPDPTTGVAGDIITVSYYGFSKSKEIAFFLHTGAALGAGTAVVWANSGQVGDGVTKTFSGTLANLPVKPGTVGVQDLAASEIFTDAGLGVLSSLAGGTGTINYVTGKWEVTFKGTPAAAAIQTKYNYYTATGTAVNDYKGTGVTGTLGYWTTTFTVPAVANGAYFVVAYDGKGISANVAWKKGQVISLSASSGNTGDVIRVNGKGWNPANTITKIEFSRAGGLALTTADIYYPAAWAFAVNPDGTWYADVVVPQGDTAGKEYTITATGSANAATRAPVDLGSAGNFVILAKSGISTTGTTSIVGDIGVSPIDRTAITGFDLTMDLSNQFSTSSLVTGKVYAADYTPPTPDMMTTAISDMEAAYTAAAGRTSPDHTELGAGNIDGMTLAPGLYKWGTGVTIPIGVTLSGNSNDVWIFQIAQGLTVGNGAIVTLSGGAQATNIFWQVAGQVTLGTTSQFNGIILCKTLIAMNTGATLNGRALAQTAVTLIANTITAPTIFVNTATKTYTINTLAHVVASPNWGPQGSDITVTGTDYDNFKDKVITVDLETTAGGFVATLGTVKTDNNGGWSKVFTVPAVASGNYKIRAYNTLSKISDKNDFKVGSVAVVVNPTSADTGRSITVTGSGFTASEKYGLKFGDKVIVDETSGVVASDGTIVKAFDVPQVAAGVYTISVKDVKTGVEITASFTVKRTTTVTISPSSAPNTYLTTFEGIGFKPAQAVTYTLYNKTSTGSMARFWPITVASPTNSTGGFKATWAVLASATLSNGQYYVDVVDAAGYKVTVPFTVSAVYIKAEPRKATFKPGETLSFVLEHSLGNVAPILASYLKVYNPSGTLVYQTDGNFNWVKVTDYYVATYSSQVSSGNQMVFADDAPIGTWTWNWKDSAGKTVKEGSFTLEASAASVTDQKIDDLSKQVTDLKTSISGITSTVQGAQTSANAASTAATAAGTKADAATAAANAAKTSADAAKAATDSLTTMVYVAIGASVVAALAAIFAVMQITKKIA